MNWSKLAKSIINQTQFKSVLAGKMHPMITKEFTQNLLGLAKISSECILDYNMILFHKFNFECIIIKNNKLL